MNDLRATPRPPPRLYHLPKSLGATSCCPGLPCAPRSRRISLLLAVIHGLPGRHRSSPWPVNVGGRDCLLSLYLCGPLPVPVPLPIVSCISSSRPFPQHRLAPTPPPLSAGASSCVLVPILSFLPCPGHGAETSGGLCSVTVALFVVTFVLLARRWRWTDPSQGTLLTTGVDGVDGDCI